MGSNIRGSSSRDLAVQAIDITMLPSTPYRVTAICTKG